MIIRVPLREIPARCWANPRAYACAYHNATTCRVYLPDNVPAKLEAALREHELGHCLGWKHPEDMRYLTDAALKRAKQSPLCRTEPKPSGCP